jgi:flagellar biosynthetic protein FliP
MRLWLLTCLALGFLFSSPEAFAQTISVDLGSRDSVAANMIQLIAIITVIGLAPSILVMVTSFTRIIVVLSILRSALGLQQSPPNMVMVSLALFLTFFIMTPVFEKSYTQGIQPLIQKKITEENAIEPITRPFHQFMITHTREKDIALFLELGNIKPVEKAELLPWRAVIPAFMISELRRAFEIGFLLFIPFLVIDMMVASTLMAMGMMMLPPVMISLPFKLIFFVLVDGWYMLAGSLVRSYGS